VSFRWFIAAACTFLFVAVVPAVGQAQVSARAQVDSTEFVVGDPITVHIQLHHPEGTVFHAAVFDTAAGFAVLERRPFAVPGSTLTRGEYVIARYDSVQAVIPPVTVWYSLPGDTTRRSVMTNQIVVAVRTMQVDTSQSFKDLKPPLPVSFSWQEIGLYALGALLFAALAWLAYWYWKRRQAKKAGAVYTPPSRPAHILALEELSLLKEKKLWQQGKIKEYYSELTEVLRRYIENRYDQPALEETTDEILQGLLKLRFPTDLAGKIDAVLRRADLAKFAKQRPGISEHEESLSVVYEVVDKTKIVPMTPVSQQETWGGGRVAG